MEKHITILGALYIASGALGAIIGLIVFVSVAGGGLLSGDLEAITITAVVGSVIGGFFLIFSVPEIICGIGLLKYKPWSRIFALILGCISLLEIPFGTALGIYTIWIFMKDETKPLFEGKKG